MSTRNIKSEIRQRIWKLLVKSGVSTFPPPYGRIPNFLGAEVTARKIREMEIYKKSKIIKVSPDSPQREIRKLILKDGKMLIMPTPRLRGGFLLLNGKKISSDYDFASTIKGAFKYGEELYPEELPNIDLIITGSVAVSINGRRLGKGGGYSELEYAILREYDKIDENITIISNVHDLQVLKQLPKDPFDITLDYIVTPTKVIFVENREDRPKGILWNFLTEEKVKEMPILLRLRREKLFKN